MTSWLYEGRNIRSGLSLFLLIFYILLLATLLWADPEQPRTVYYYNELFFLPLVVMMAPVMLQREMAGSMMELNAAYRVSLPKLLTLKGSWMFMMLISAHMGWYQLYQWKFGGMATTVYSYFTGAAIVQNPKWFVLFLQAFPAYFLILNVSVLMMILGKRTYFGLLAGFSFWLVEVLSQGKLFNRFSLMTVHRSPEIPFWYNRLWLFIAACLCGWMALWIFDRRRRWVINEEIM